MCSVSPRNPTSSPHISESEFSGLRNFWDVSSDSSRKPEKPHQSQPQTQTSCTQKFHSRTCCSFLGIPNIPQSHLIRLALRPKQQNCCRSRFGKAPAHDTVESGLRSQNLLTVSVRRIQPSKNLAQLFATNCVTTVDHKNSASHVLGPGADLHCGPEAARLVGPAPGPKNRFS